MDPASAPRQSQSKGRRGSGGARDESGESDSQDEQGEDAMEAHGGGAEEEEEEVDGGGDDRLEALARFQTKALLKALSFPQVSPALCPRDPLVPRSPAIIIITPLISIGSPSDPLHLPLFLLLAASTL